MNSILKHATDLLGHYNTEQRQSTVLLLVKSLYFFILIKIVFLWPVISDIIKYLPTHLVTFRSQVAYAPIGLAQENAPVFLVGFVLLLIVAMIVRLNYLTAAMIWWLSFCLSKMTGPVMNGSDQVLNLLLLVSIPLCAKPVALEFAQAPTQSVISAFAFFLCRIQLSLIYFLSGFDKITSPAWRSGEAVYSIVNLEYYFNPHVSPNLSEWMYIGLGWIVILFELSFPFLLWSRRHLLKILLVGVIFHLGIIFFLSLPDFGLVMILSLIVFLPEHVAERIILVVAPWTNRVKA